MKITKKGYEKINREWYKGLSGEEEKSEEKK